MVPLNYYLTFSGLCSRIAEALQKEEEVDIVNSSNQNGVTNEIRRWRAVGKRFSLLLEWPKLRYEEPASRCSAESAPALKSLDIFELKGGVSTRAACISITDEEYGLGGGFRWSFKDIQVDVFSVELCDELLQEFEQWYQKTTGKNVRFILHLPYYRMLPSRYEARFDHPTRLQSA